MKVFTVAAVACGLGFVGHQASAEPAWFWSPTKAPATKVITLDHNIIPTWAQLGTTKKTKKIRLIRLKKYWAALEKRDKAAIKTMYSTLATDYVAATKIDNYYDGAKACLQKQHEYARKDKTQIEIGLLEIEECMDKTVTAPTFTVLASQNLPSDYFSPVAVDFGSDSVDDEKEDAEEEATAAPVVVLPPAEEVKIYESPTVTSAYNEPAVAMEPTNEPTTAVATEQPTTEQTNEPTTPVEAEPATIAVGSTETFQPEPITPVEIETKTPEFVEPYDVIETTTTETIQPEPVEPVEVETTSPEFVEPAGLEDTDPVTKASETPVANEGTLAPGDETYITKEINAPEKPEPYHHDLPSVVETEEPVIISETNAPEKPQEFHHDLPPIVPTTEPMIISEIDAPELDPTRKSDIQEPPIEVQYVDQSGGTTAPKDFSPTGEPVIETVPVEPTVEYETETPVAPPTEPIAVAYSDPSSGTTTNPEPFHPMDVVDEEPADILDEKTMTPIETEMPAALTESPEDVMPEVVQPDAASWPFSPVSRNVPPLWALDLDRSGSIDFHEWQVYMMRLHEMASQEVTQGHDEVAVALLHTIVDFHYNSLRQCIAHKLMKENLAVLKSPQYEDITHWIEANCYVKFRYSLFAGPAPFEWVAKQQPTVTAAEIEAWFTQKVNSAREDARAMKALDLTPEQHTILERLVGCTYTVLKSAGDEPIHREKFYAGLSAIDKCAAQ